ncbi:MAG: S9 family peptidase [Solimonas sp.]
MFFDSFKVRHLAGCLVLAALPHAGLAQAGPSSAAAYGPRAMTAVDLLELARISAPNVSPDGNTVLFSRSSANWAKNSMHGQLFRMGSEGSGLRQMLDTSGADLQWSPDGRCFAFVARRGKDKVPQLYVMPIDGGDAQRVMPRKTAVGSPRWSADGRQIYFLADGKAPGTRRQPKDDMVPFEEPRRRRELWRVTVATGQVERVAHGDDYDIETFDLSRDGRAVVYRRAPSKLHDDSPRAELWLQALDDAKAKPRQLTDNDYEESDVRFSPDGRRVLFIATAENDRYGTFNRNLFVLDAGGGAPRELMHGLPYAIEDAQWLDDGRIAFLATTGVRCELFAVDVRSERMSPLARGDFAIAGMSVSRDGRTIVYSANSATSPGELYRLDTRKPKPVQITHEHDDLPQRFRLPKQVAIRWTTADGQPLEGLLTYPLDYVEGRRYPLIVQNHGGPRSSDVFNLFAGGRFLPLLAARGVMTLSVNYRGGTAYGDTFLQGMNGGYFRYADKDVLSGVDHVVALGLADPDRLGVMGWSAGGHMTNRLVTVTDRFKAAASGAGAVDWPSMYLTSDTRWQRKEWFETAPYGSAARRDLYTEYSPLSSLDKVRTPMLILAGAQDERVPWTQSVMLYRSLKALGVEAHLYLAPREPHNFKELQHRLFQINVQMQWFVDKLLGERYEFARSPAGPEKKGVADPGEAGEPRDD